MTRFAATFGAVVVFVVVLSATSAAGSSQGAVALNARFAGPIEEIACPSGTPPTPITECYLSEAEGQVPGLGPTSLKFTLFKALPYGQSDLCRIFSTPDATFAVAGEGEIELAATNPSCQTPPLSGPGGSMQFIVTGGSGIYAGAAGSGTMRFTSFLSENSKATSTWTGTLAVAGVDFDTNPPTISGASNKVVKIKKNTRRARVSYSVTATDAVDGTVPVTCTPRSGAFFPVGRTQVRCSATDSNSNTTGASFRVTVTRR